ncbi:MAG: LacI family DNA-binding transcriptional regulator [Pontibacterium sp.]
MKKRPTIHDVAAAANVSVATVDRVLNKRTKVREATAQRVLLAADEVGYHASGLLKQRLSESRPVKRIYVLLQRSNDLFYAQIGDAIEQVLKRIDRYQFAVTLEYSESISAEKTSQSILRHKAHADAMVVVAVDHHRSHDAIEEVRSAGIPVISLVSPLSPQTCSGHIGLDHRKAGRSAAWAITRLCKKPGKVGILLGTHRYLSQQTSEDSFTRFFRESAPQFQLIEPILNLDEDELAAKACQSLLSSHPDLVGLYSAGGGVNGIINTLKQFNFDHNERPVVICNENTLHTRAGLQAGWIDLVIATPVQQIANELYPMLTDLLSFPPQAQTHVIELAAELYIKENL